MLGLFKNKNFLFLFNGRLITNVGDSIYSVAAMWLIFELTQNSFYTGVAGALILLPGVFEFLVGPLVDRWSLKTTLIYTQLLQALLISLIPISYYFNMLNVWLIIIVMFLATCLEQLVYPAHQAAMPKILGKDDLVTGNSLMTFAYQGTDFLFIGLSGLLIIHLGAINLYVIDVFTFIIAALFFRLMDISKSEQEDERTASLKESAKNYLIELKEGKNYVFNSVLPKLLIPFSIVNFIFGMITAILPEYSNTVGSEAFYGYFLASMSISMLLGSLLAQKLSKYPFGAMTIISFSLASISWFLSYYINNPILMVIFFGLTFIPISANNVILLSTLQGLIPETIIGRAFAWISSISGIFLPIGAFTGGILASKMGTGNIMLLGSIGLLFISIYWLSYPLLRKIPVPDAIKAGNYGLDQPSNITL